MTTEKAFFILEHGSSKGLQVYLEAVDTIKENCVEVVLCKDCKHRYNGCCYNKTTERINFTVSVPDDWFCADGERK